MNDNLHSAAARFRELLSRHERMLRWMCLRRAYADIELADDYFQEVSLVLWQEIPTLTPDLPPRQERAYVKKVARFALSHCSRKNRHNLQHLEPEMIIALDQLDKENEQFLNDLVDALPESDRLVVGLYRAGYEAPDIARFLGTSTNAVSQRYRRAVAKMKAIVEKENNLLKKVIR